MENKTIYDEMDIHSSDIGVARIFDWGANHKSHAMTSSKIFKRGTVYGEKILQNGRSEAVACVALNQDFGKGRDRKLIVRKCKCLT